MIYNRITELIGNTPILCANKFAEKMGITSNILLKLEFFNPAGSSKDRAAIRMLEDALKEGVINDGDTVIEPTSGNTGIGLAMAAVSFGLKVILTMPDTMSVERRKILSAYGAQIVLTEGALGMKGAIDKAVELKNDIKGAFIPSQFDNPSNPLSHYETTGPEIWRDTEGNVDVFVACVGTGGTISGVGRYLKEKKPNVEIVAVEPDDSPLISKGVSGRHAIQGIGANFIPDNYDPSVVDRVVTATNEESFETLRALAKLEGCLVGISSGAAVAAAVKLARKEEYKEKNIVILCPDTGMRYLSEKELF